MYLDILRGKVFALGVLVWYAPLEDVLVTYTPILHGYKYFAYP